VLIRYIFLVDFILRIKYFINVDWIWWIW